jgi:hypothetical protein
MPHPSTQPIHNYGRGLADSNVITVPEVWSPQADRRAVAVVFGGGATSVLTSFHRALDA